MIIYTKGEKVGLCVFLRDLPEKRNGNRLAIFLCNCGNEFKDEVRSVKKLDTRGCKECASKSRAKTAIRIGTKHGMAHSKEYLCYLGIKKRCTNPNAKNYKYYGGRGIKMCERWLNSFENFLFDMGKMPAEGYSVERDENEKGYEPENCRWIPLEDQKRNKRNRVFIIYNGESKLVTDWEELYGFPDRSLYRKVFKQKIPVDVAMASLLDRHKLSHFEIKHSFGFIDA